MKEHAEPNAPFFWFETGKQDRYNRLSYYFHDPDRVLVLYDPADTQEYFASVEKLARTHYVAGFLSYELGYALEPAFGPQRPSRFPYALFYACKAPAIYNHRKDRFVQGSFKAPSPGHRYRIEGLRLNETQRRYMNDVARIKRYIRAGDIYQANYTMKYKFRFSGSPLGLYLDLKRKQTVAYNVFARFGTTHIISLSPELFFDKRGRSMRVKPMKGTVGRGRNMAEDRAKMAFLGADEKNRAENLMIVDLLRNDLGKASEYGSVRVPKLFEVERFNTLFQMTSTVTSTLRRKVSFHELLCSMFPSGSVTGAPKIRSMQVIRELEQEPRRLYTGAIGFLTPGGTARFNIAIRTVLIDSGRGEMGIGGGIVADSKAADEFEEAKLKGQFLVRAPQPEFRLIETMLLSGRRYRNLSLHMERLSAAAEYFGFPFNRTDIVARLRATARGGETGSRRVRLLIDKEGSVEIEPTRLPETESECVLTVSPEKTDSRDPMRFFKTTNRELYNRELKRVRKNGFYDVLFRNERGNITEGAMTNVYVRSRGVLYTPPVECGLLDGTMRQAVMGRRGVKEKRLTLSDLKRAEAVYVSNAVIGFREAELRV